MSMEIYKLRLTRAGLYHASMGPCFYEHGNSGRANAFGRNVLEACFRAVAKYGIRGAEILVETEPLSL